MSSEWPVHERQGPGEAGASVRLMAAVLVLLIAQAREPAVRCRGMCMYRMPACAHSPRRQRYERHPYASG